MKNFLIIPLVLLAAGLKANDPLPDLRVKTPGGTMMIHEVKLMRIEPDGLRVSHANGMAKVDYELLPQELQVKYGFSDQKAKEHRQTVAAAAAPQPAPVVAIAPASAPSAVAAAAPLPTYQSIYYPSGSRSSGQEYDNGNTRMVLPAPLNIAGPSSFLRIIVPETFIQQSSGCSSCQSR